MHESAPLHDLTNAMAGAIAPQLTYTPELHRALVSYVRALRADGLPPERALVLVKQLALRTVDACIGYNARESDAHRQFMSDVVGQCIRAYYRDD
jgi:hypothetical protein